MQPICCRLLLATLQPFLASRRGVALARLSLCLWIVCVWIACGQRKHLMPTKSVKLQSRGRRVFSLFFFFLGASPTQQKKSQHSHSQKRAKKKETEKRALLINLAFFWLCRVSRRQMRYTQTDRDRQRQRETSGAYIDRDTLHRSRGFYSCCCFWRFRSPFTKKKKKKNRKKNGGRCLPELRQIEREFVGFASGSNWAITVSGLAIRE